ncbi:MAG: aminotransferase class III-fold pyridoxal phosphate-dependent enzyme, partial [Usitatibacter sp.]
RLAGGTHSRCVFTTSGAEAIEAAIKLARMRTGREVILSAVGSYHGKTLGALSASERMDGSSLSSPAFARVPFGDAPALAAYLSQHGSRCAAFLVEPIQGEGGVHEPPNGYLREARALCDQNGVLLIADEIQTGLFRAGHALACHAEGVAADIVCLAKALGGGVFPLGAVLVNGRAWDAGFALAHSSTFANNNIACAAGLAVIEEIQRPAFQENLATTSMQLEDGLADLARRYPGSVKEVRGRGLMRAIELRAPPATAGYFLNYLHQQGLSAYLFASVLAKNHGVLVLPVLNASSVVRIAPPLVSRPEHVAQLLAGLQETLALWESHSSHVIARAAMRPSVPSIAPLDGARLVLPRHRVRATESIDYAFLIHPTTLADVLLNDPTFARFSAHELEAYCSYCTRLPPGVVCEIPEIVSAVGSRARGALVAIPLLPEQMAERGRADVSKAIAQAVDLAHARGARIVGLGAFTSIYSRKGQLVAGRGPHITTGNLLTAGMTFRALLRVLGDRGQRIADLRVGIVGARGSVGSLMAQLVARESPREIVLVGNPDGALSAVERVAKGLSGLGTATLRPSRDLTDLAGCDVVVSASSAGRPILDEAGIRAGAIVCDVARPFDTSEAMRARRDLTVIEAGSVALPGAPIRIGAGNLQDHPAGVALACLSETMLLALHGADRNYGVGDDLDVNEVDAVLALADHHGFELSDHGLPRFFREVAA